jgi:hypothetical protein
MPQTKEYFQEYYRKNLIKKLAYQNAYNKAYKNKNSPRPIVVSKGVLVKFQ